MSDQNKLYHDDLVEYLKQIRSNKYYSHQRLDVLVIVIATSGIFVLSNFLLTEKYQTVGLKVALLLFAMSVILNIVSQILSAEAHSILEMIYAKKVRDLRDEDSIDESKYRDKESRIRKRSEWIIVLNYGSIIVLLAALSIATVSFISTF